MSLTRKLDCLIFDYYPFGENVWWVYHVGDLGVEVDCWLGFYLHVLRIKSSTNMWCDFTWTKKVSHITCLVCLYCPLVRSYLEFSSTLWNSPFLTFNDLIKKVQRFVCVVYDRCIGCQRFYNCSSIFSDLGLKNVSYKWLADNMNYSHQVVCGTFGCDVLLSLLHFGFCVAKIASVFVHPTKFLGLFVQWHNCETLTIHHFFSQWHIWHF